MLAKQKKTLEPSDGAAAPPVVEVKAGVFKDTCLNLLDRVNRREFEVVVTKHGTPMARVVPESGSVPSAYGFLSGTVVEHDDIVSPDFEAWGDLA